MPYADEMIDAAPLETIVGEYEEGDSNYWDRLVFVFITFRKIWGISV